jgi:nucleoside-diphosphate-sugar epimerase
MTVLVTGATGFLGSHIAEQLCRAGQPVRALVRRSSDTAFLRTLPGVELSLGAIEDQESFVEAAKGATAIIHVAGLVKARSEDEFRRTNVGGAENALVAARKAGVRRLVLVSSQSVAGPSRDGLPIPEGAEPNPVTAYARSKLQGERAVLAGKGDVPVTVIRPPLIYGPRDREVLAFFKAINAGVLAIMGSASTKVSVVYGADCAEACVRAVDAEVPSGSIYYVEDGRTRTFGELVTSLERALGKRAWLRVPLSRRVVEAVALGSEVYGRATNRAVMLTRDKCNELFGQWVCDAGSARTDLGWTPKTSFEQGAELTAAWYREARWL